MIDILCENSSGIVSGHPRAIVQLERKKYL